MRKRDPHLRGLIRRKGKKSTRYYYYVDRTKPPVYLGKDEIEAKKKCAELNAEAAKEKYEDKAVSLKPIFRDAIRKYIKNVLDQKKPKTKKEYTLVLKRLDDAYGHLTFEKILPQHIRKHLDVMKNTPVQANRDKAMISTLWNHARGWGLTSLPNPCDGVKGYTEKAREVYVEDSLFNHVYAHAEDYIQLAMRLAYYMSQRPGDARKASESDISTGFIDGEKIEILAVQQNKRGKKLRLAVTGGLKEVIHDIRAYKLKNGAECQQLLCKGSEPLTEAMLRNGFDKARKAANIDFETFQFRDIRAKSGTDIEEEYGKEHAKNALGHDQESTTNRYLRNRKGVLVNPVSKKLN